MIVGRKTKSLHNTRQNEGCGAATLLDPKLMPMKKTNPINFRPVVLLSVLLAWPAAGRCADVEGDAEVPVLVGRWDFEEGTGERTMNSVNGSMAEMVGEGDGGVRFQEDAMSGKYSLEFTRGSDPHTGGHVILEVDEDDLDVTRDFTVCFWVKLKDAEAGTEGILSNQIGAWDRLSFFIEAGQGVAGSETRGIAPILMFSPFNWENLCVGLAGNAMPPGQWHHYAVTHQASGRKITVYLDGEERHWGTYDEEKVVNPNTGSFILGRGAALNPETSQFFNGSLDDVRFYRGCLAPADIKAVRNE